MSERAQLSFKQPVYTDLAWLLAGVACHKLKKAIILFNSHGCNNVEDLWLFALNASQAAVS